MNMLPSIIPKKVELQTWSKDERTAILQLKEIKNAMLNMYIPFTFRFVDPISPLVVPELESKGYTVTTEEKQIPETYLARHGFKKTRYNIRYFINIS